MLIDCLITERKTGVLIFFNTDINISVVFKSSCFRIFPVIKNAIDEIFTKILFSFLI